MLLPPIGTFDELWLMDRANNYWKERIPDEKKRHRRIAKLLREYKEIIAPNDQTCDATDDKPE